MQVSLDIIQTYWKEESKLGLGKFEILNNSQPVTLKLGFRYSAAQTYLQKPISNFMIATTSKKKKKLVNSLAYADVFTWHKKFRTFKINHLHFLAHLLSPGPIPLSICYYCHLHLFSHGFI